MIHASILPALSLDIATNPEILRLPTPDEMLTPLSSQ